MGQRAQNHNSSSYKGFRLILTYVNQQQIYSEVTNVFQLHDPKFLKTIINTLLYEQWINYFFTIQMVLQRDVVGISNLHKSYFPEVYFHILFWAWVAVPQRKSGM